LCIFFLLLFRPMSGEERFRCEEFPAKRRQIYCCRFCCRDRSASWSVGRSHTILHLSAVFSRVASTAHGDGSITSPQTLWIGLRQNRPPYQACWESVPPPSLLSSADCTREGRQRRRLGSRAATGRRRCDCKEGVSAVLRPAG